MQVLFSVCGGLKLVIFSSQSLSLYSSSPFVLPLCPPPLSSPFVLFFFPPPSSPFVLRYSVSSGNICVYGFNDGLPSLVERIITALDPLNDNPLCILNDPLLQRRFPQIMERRLRSKRNFTKVNRLIIPSVDMYRFVIPSTDG